MKKLLSLLVLLFVVFLAQSAVQGQNIPQIQYFELNTWQKQDNGLVLQGSFYVFEDLSLYLGDASIAYSCLTGTYHIDEIVNVPESITYGDITLHQEDIIASLYYIMGELIVYANDDSAPIFEDWQPDSLYNQAHYTYTDNWQAISSFVSFDHAGNCPTIYTTYLPIIAK